jgi:hypothetical protein
MFLYTGVGFLAVMGAMLGFVQWQSSMAPWGFWGLALGIPGLAILYWISATGQKLSSHQMADLKDRIDGLVEGLEADDTAERDLTQAPASRPEPPVQSPST